jgi:hypothetical protein
MTQIFHPAMNSVTTSSFAGIPPTYTCMTCHSQIFTTRPILQPVRTSMQSNPQLQWVRVNDLPDFVYFNDSIHVTKGIGFVTCHGQVDKVPLTGKLNTLFMSWCLDCYRAPERHIRPREEVLNLNWKPPDDQLTLGKSMVMLSTLATTIHVLRTYRSEERLREPAIVLLLPVLFQASLGALTVLMRKGVEVTTAHGAVGALVLAGSVLLTVRAFQLYRAPERAAISESEGQPTAASAASA